MSFKKTAMDSNKLLQLKVKCKVSIRCYLTSETAAWICYHWSDNSLSIHFNSFTPLSTLLSFPNSLKLLYITSYKSCSSYRWNANVSIGSYLISETDWLARNYQEYMLICVCMYEIEKTPNTCSRLQEPSVLTSLSRVWEPLWEQL